MQRTRVLVAEDNDIIRGGIRELLARAPEFELVGEAQDGRQAIELTSKLQPDIVLLDLRMPDVDGASAARQITSSRPASRIIVVTADDSAHAERLARSVGAVALVTKDECVTALIPTLRDVVAGKTPLAEPAPTE